MKEIIKSDMNGNEMVTVEKRSKPSVGVEVDS
jgi:hypothetical protein